MSFPRALIHELNDGTVIYAWHPSISGAEAPADFAHTVAIPGLLDALSHRGS